MRTLQIPTFKKSLMLAGLFHLVLFVALMIRVAFPVKASNELIINPQVVPIQATAISEKELQSELKRLDNIEKKKRDDKLAKEQAIKEAQEKLVQEKLAKERAIKEAQEKLAQEKIAKERAIAEQKRQADIQKQQKLAEQKRIDDQRKKTVVAAAAPSVTPQPTAATPASPETLREIERYKAMVRQQIMRYWVVQGGLAKQEATKLFVRVAPTGTVLDVKVVQSSGNDALDRSAIAAVYKASPLPVPQDPELFRAFRELRLTLRPDSILSEG